MVRFLLDFKKNVWKPNNININSSKSLKRCLTTPKTYWITAALNDWQRQFKYVLWIVDKMILPTALITMAIVIRNILWHPWQFFTNSESYFMRHWRAFAIPCKVLKIESSILTLLVCTKVALMRLCLAIVIRWRTNPLVFL